MFSKEVFLSLGLGLGALVATACETKSDKGVVDESGAEISASQVRVAGRMAYGDSKSSRYRNGPLSAFSFTGQGGDVVTIDVTSTNGDPVTWLLDDRYTTLASNDDVSGSDVSSRIETTLPGDAGTEATFYVAFRDYAYETRYFSVKIAGVRPSQKIIRLTEDRCASGKNRYLANGVNAGPEDLALDTYCAELILGRVAPQGFIAIFGSSRLSDGTPEYTSARVFATEWTAARRDLPILTGGGPGLMEAGNRGAKDAGGVSLGFSTYFKTADDKLNDYVTHGYMFTDFAVRERAMLNYAKAAVVFPGGVGTAWELFMTVSQVQTKRLNPMPIIVVSPEMATSFRPYLDWMAAKGTISPTDIDLITVVSTPEQAVAAIQAAIPAPR